MKCNKRDTLLRLAHDAHGQDLRRYVIRLTNGQTHFADDVLQESLTRLWSRPEILEQSSESVRRWLFTVARNLVVDNRRSAQFTRETAMAAVPDVPAADLIGAALDRSMLVDALLTLSHNHRSTVLRAYYLAQSLTDIARQDRIPVGTVKSRLHYALRALRSALDERGFVL
ncbi:sigma-70 family RNA polymerase sigma factor [Mycolicibacterium sp. Dal123E01]|uniref:sigma-70 family RNA polymerase sigma factor n=1 Tax=Mycolicibacterium sp. Dal123E01 TaxID=3457578 RepID=UPI00403E3BC4